MNEPDFDWKAWRQGERQRLIQARQALDEENRRTRNKAIDELLAEGFGALAGMVIGFCWPISAEPDARFAVRRWREQGSRAALPVVMAPRCPLEFREWWPGAPTETGVYDIPYPVGTEVLTPEAGLVPVNGFDAEGYRLGYGGGFFDRTLAALERKPVCIGLGYEIARMETIHPQPHDIPFDFIVTEAGIHVRAGGGLQPIDPADVGAAVRALRVERGLSSA